VTTKLVLHDYWRSGAAWRVRIALNLKGLDHLLSDHDLRTGAQRDPAYLAIAPQGLVPALETGTETLTQSLAIIEWLEESHPTPALLPYEPGDRAIVRAMAALIACDVHPLNNLRVLQALRKDFGANDVQVNTWIAHWIGEGFAALEEFIRRYGGAFAYGDAPTLADCCLVPQVYSARRFGVDLSPYPKICAVDAQCGQHPAFAAAHASNQPGSET
jgi:maleylpyruvate isomerase